MSESIAGEYCFTSAGLQASPYCGSAAVVERFYADVVQAFHGTPPRLVTMMFRGGQIQ